jgi:hypothetical protein
MPADAAQTSTRPGGWSDRLAVITGASSGIGQATARRLAAAGLRVVLVGRRLERLLHVRDEIVSAGGRADVICADLSSDVDRRRIFDHVGRADVLVNSAGLGWYGYFADMPWETARELLLVNVTAAAHLTSLFLPGMRLRRFGHIINVGSIAGSLPSQGVALYSASKSFMDAFTTALHRETVRSGVHSSVVRAGPVKTEFYQVAVRSRHSLQIPAERLGTTAGHVASRIWDLLLRPRRVVYVPRWLRIVPWVELTFGWLEDLLGPALLKRNAA